MLVTRMKANGVVADPRLLDELSRKRRVVGCDEESHVMYSASSEWRDGSEVWAVTHSSETAADDLDVRGDPPPGWEAIRDEHREQQGQDDRVDFIYEIPLVIAQRVVGYRLESDDDDLDFVTLAPRDHRHSPLGSARRWWKFW